MKQTAIWISLSVLLCLASPIASAENNGASLFQSRCAMCHGADGRGNTPAGKAFKAPDFHDSEVIKMTDAELETIIGKGKGKMPAYENRLSGNQIKGLVAYIRTLQSK